MPNDVLSYYKDKTILVTGAAGYLGSSLIKALSTVSCRVIALVREKSILDSLAGLTGKITVERADVKDARTWEKFLSSAEIVFHLAAQTSVYAANQDPLKDIENNLLPVVNFLNGSEKSRKKSRIVFAGTATEVGLTDSWPVDENFSDHPMTVYDVNKLAAEKYIAYYGMKTGAGAVTLRLANVYGPGASSSSADRGILNQMVRKALQGETLSIYGDGNFVRDYIYIDDVIRAFLAAGAKAEVLNGNYYLIGSGVGHSIKDMVNLVGFRVGHLVGKPVTVRHVAAPDGLSSIEFRNFIADSGAFARATGWRPEFSLEEGIDRTIEFFLKKDG